MIPLCFALLLSPALWICFPAKETLLSDALFLPSFYLFSFSFLFRRKIVGSGGEDMEWMYAVPSKMERTSTFSLIFKSMKVGMKDFVDIDVLLMLLFCSKWVIVVVIVAEWFNVGFFLYCSFWHFCSSWYTVDIVVDIRAKKTSNIGFYFSSISQRRGCSSKGSSFFFANEDKPNHFFQDHCLSRAFRALDYKKRRLNGSLSILSRFLFAVTFPERGATFLTHTKYIYLPCISFLLSILRHLILALSLFHKCLSPTNENRER